MKISAKFMKLSPKTPGHVQGHEHRDFLSLMKLGLAFRLHTLASPSRQSWAQVAYIFLIHDGWQRFDMHIVAYGALSKRCVGPEVLSLPPVMSNRVQTPIILSFGPP